MIFWNDPTSRQRIPRTPRGLVGMLVLVALVELAIGGHPRDFSTVWADDWRRTAEVALSESRDRDLLCFGDSLIKYGVLPRVIEARTGWKGYNLAVNAGTMPSEYFLLKRALGSGAKPKAIVADFFALMLADQPRGSIRAYPELASWTDCLDLAWNTGDADLGAMIGLGKLLPSVRCRFEIQCCMKSALKGLVTRQKLADRQLWKLWKNQLGAQPMPEVPGQPVANPALVADLTPSRWSVDAINAHYFEQFVNLAEAHQIPVFWVMPPLGPEVEAGRLAHGTSLAYSQFARDAQARHPDLVVLDARSASYGASMHVDSIHLNSLGATVLSNQIAAAITDRLALRNRMPWYDLPRFSDPVAISRLATGRREPASAR